MAAIEHLLISKIIEDQSLLELTKAGVKPAHFHGDWEDIYQWILTYYGKHGAVPSERAFHRAYGDVDIEDTSQETFSGLIDDLLRGYRFRVVGGAMSEATNALNNNDLDTALRHISQGMATASADTTRLRDFNIVENWEERYQRYVENSENPNSLRGIPTGFVGLDRITHGFRPQQWIVMVGEQKRGKSLFQLIMADAAHRFGRRPMFVSFEMSVEEQLARWDSLTAKIPYDRILSGNLTKKELDILRRTMKAHNPNDFWMSEDTSSLTTVTAIAGKLQEHQPDALYVDGIYLMDDENGEPKGSPQALTNISRGMKRLAQRFDIPIIGTTQVLSWKLNNKRTRAITADAIGYTSAFAQDADLVLGVERHPDVDGQAIIRVVEARTAPRATINVLWDFETMQFEEVDDDGPIDPSYDD